MGWLGLAGLALAAGTMGCSSHTTVAAQGGEGGTDGQPPVGGNAGAAGEGGTDGGSSPCTSGEVRCVQQVPGTCSANRVWVDGAPCVNQACVEGECVGECTPGSGSCAEGNTPRTCNAAGVWVGGNSCSNQTCVEGTCQGSCAPGQLGCNGNTPRTCGVDGNWTDGTTCPASTPICVGGTCQAGGPSCTGLPAACGSTGNLGCCSSSVVTGGSFNRNNDASLPATISSFKLDNYEITVGRFRNFVEAGFGTQQNPPITGSGAHPNLPGSGWTAGWNADLAPDKATLYVRLTENYTTVDPLCHWTNTAAGSENAPMNCVNWLEVFAFCIWDGGYLPTEAEWNYAAMGGTNYWMYPWGNETPDSSLAVFQTATPVAVGSKPLGDGYYGQSDLAGNMWEWYLDAYTVTPVTPCTDCAFLSATSTDRGVRGGGWASAATTLRTYDPSPYAYPRTMRTYSFDARCARRL